MPRFFLKSLLALAASLPLQQAGALETQAAPAGGSREALALTELAAAQFRDGDLSAAEENYLHALVLLEDDAGISSPHFIAPLAGLAAIYAAQGRHDRAVDFYRQAIAINRRAFGLFNPAQAALLDGLASSSMALGLYTDAEDQYRYRVQIAARNFGAGDPRTLPPLWQLGRWYESVHNHESARRIYSRIYEIARDESGDSNPATVHALLALGRTYRLQFWDEPELASQPYAAAEQLSLNPMPGVEAYRKRDFRTFRLDRNGQRALHRALDVLEEQDDPPYELLVATLIELGDWYMASRQPDVALGHYSRAMRLFAERASAAQASPLAAVRLAVFHAPPTSIKYRLLPRDQLLVRQANFTLTVDERGATRDIVLVRSDMSEMQAFQLRQALEDARFSPRFEDGRPVATAGVEFTGQWYDRAPVSTADPQLQATGGP